MKTKNAADPVLDLPMDDNEAGANTIREYLIQLLVELWEQEDGFSGKRPFGSSGWTYDLYKPLIVAKLVTGEIDNEGYITEVDSNRANDIIREAIRRLK